MNITRTSPPFSDDELRAAATEIRESAPRAHPWESLSADFARPPLTHGPRSGRILIGVAAASILVVGVLATMAVADRTGPPAPSAASSALPTVPPDGQSWSPVLEQPMVTPDIDALPVSADAENWIDRALFPAETPADFTIESVSQSAGGDFTESGGVDTGDVAVNFITTTPSGTADDARITIETVPAGIGRVSSDSVPATIVTGNDARWDVYIEQTPEGSFSSTAYVRTQGAGGTVSLTAADSAEEAKDKIVALLESLRLVRIDEIPTEVIDLNRLPVVATVEPDDASSGVIRAQRTTNAWCLVTSIADGGVSGCGFRIDPRHTPAVFIELSYNDDNIVTLSGMAAPDAKRIEISLTDGTTLGVEPTFPTNSVEGIGFWAVTHTHDGPIPQQGPVLATQVFDVDGNTLGEVQAR